MNFKSEQVQNQNKFSNQNEFQIGTNFKI
jgi:hypothetical protein